jgi:AsmA protein
VGVRGFAEPAIKFDVEANQFDADLYLPKTPVAKASSPSTSNQPEQPIDLSALRKLNLDGSLRIGALKVMNVKATQLRVDVKALNGQVNINPLYAKLYQGSINGSLSVNAQGMPSVAIIQNLSGVNVAPLAKDAANLDMLEGKGNIGLNLSSRGNTVSAMKKALNGNFSLNLVDGAIKGIDIDKKLLEAQALLSKGGGATSETQSANKDEKTVFKEFKATFKVASGVAHNDDLSLRSDLVRVSGAGDINIGNDSVDYNAKASISKTPDGKGGITVPLHVSGPYTQLKYKLDYAAMVKEAVKQKVDAKVESQKEELKNKLNEKLKGLFK